MEFLPEIPSLHILQEVSIPDLFSLCQSNRHWLKFCLRKENKFFLQNRRSEFIHYYHELQSTRQPIFFYMLMISAGAVSPDEVLTHAIHWHYIRLIKYILEHYPIDPSPYLASAVRLNNLRIAELLLDYGADPNQFDQGESLLYLAVAAKNLPMVRLLLDHHADVDIHNQNSLGLTPLIEAVMVNNPAIVKLLLYHGADPNLVGSKGQVPLIMALYPNNLSIVYPLVEYGADLNAKDRQGRTALKVASTLHGDKYVKTLLAHQPQE